MKLQLFLPVLLIGVGAAWFSAHRANEAHAALSALTEEQTRLTKALDEANARSARARKTTEDLQVKIRSLSTTASTAKTAVETAPSSSGRIIEDDPNLQNLQAAARRAQLVITYGPLYRSLGLSAEQIDKFEQNMLRREEQQADLYATTKNSATSLNTDPVYQKLSGQVESEYQAAQAALLGEAGSRQLRDYERLSNVRETVSGMAAAAAMAGTPLNNQQAEQLTTAIAASATNYPNSDYPNTSSIDWRLVHEQAKTFLSDAQLTFIETTEPRGPRGSGGRFLPALNGAIDAAAREETKSHDVAGKTVGP